MKKILALIMVIVLSASASYAMTFGQALRKAFRQDVNNVKKEVKATNRSIKKSVKSDIKAVKKETKQNIKDTKKEIRNIKKDIKKQVKTDIENSRKAQAEAEAARKKQAISEINSKIAILNKEKKAVKSAKNITETERTIRTRALQRQIDYYNRQKSALK